MRRGLNAKYNSYAVLMFNIRQNPNNPSPTRISLLLSLKLVSIFKGKKFEVWHDIYTFKKLKN